MLLYHGTSTEYLEKILEEGLAISLAGFGQSGLSGVGLLPDNILGLGEASGYACSAAAYSTFQPVLLTVEIPDHLKLKDLRGLKKIRWIYFQEYQEVWSELLERTDHYPVTLILMYQGYQGAIIDSTLGNNREPEYIIFDPELCQVTDYQIFERTRY